MLTKLQIENFKAFAHGTLNVKPLTLIYGQNSAGKSSILDALVLLSYLGGEGAKTGIPDPVRFKHSGTQVDFGDLKSLHHLQKEDENIKFVLEGVNLDLNEFLDDQGEYTPCGISVSIKKGTLVGLTLSTEAGELLFTYKSGQLVWNRDSKWMDCFLEKLFSQFHHALSMRSGARIHSVLPKSANGWLGSEIGEDILNPFVKDQLEAPDDGSSDRLLYNLGCSGTGLSFTEHHSTRAIHCREGVHIYGTDFNVTSEMPEMPDNWDDLVLQTVTRSGRSFFGCALATRFHWIINALISHLKDGIIYFGPLRETINQDDLIRFAETLKKNKRSESEKDQTSNQDDKGWHLNKVAINKLNK